MLQAVIHASHDIFMHANLFKIQQAKVVKGFLDNKYNKTYIPHFMLVYIVVNVVAENKYVRVIACHVMNKIYPLQLTDSRCLGSLTVLIGLAY